jgi:putative acetyltransferase
MFEKEDASSVGGTGRRFPHDWHVPAIRPARDSDSDQIIDLIAAAFSEYPGCVLDVDGESPHLRRPASAFAENGGQLWVVEEDGRIMACGGFTEQDGHFELKHLYVALAARKQGLANRLCQMIEEAARERGRQQVELWTDTRFADAHRLYERRGYVRGPSTRELHDLSLSVEYYYSKQLARKAPELRGASP